MLTYFLVLLSVLHVGLLGNTSSGDESHLEIEKLQADLKQMKHEVAALRSLVTKDRKREFREKRILMHSDTDTVSEINKLQEEIILLRQGQGTVYVRWGKTECPQKNGTTMIYKGYMAGNYYQHGGDGTNSLCLPEDPTWGNFKDGSSGDHGYIYGTEYQESGNTIFGKAVLNQDVPCAVCKVTGASVMIPARVDCYPGWTLEYTGYIMAAYHAHPSHDYTCIDADPDFIFNGAANKNGHLLYLIESRCGPLPCPPYANYKALACVVCSI